MSFIFGKCSFVQCEETNVCFVLLYCVIFVLKMFSCSKSMTLNNFVVDFFPVSCTVFEFSVSEIIGVATDLSRHTVLRAICCSCHNTYRNVYKTKFTFLKLFIWEVMTGSLTDGKRWCWTILSLTFFPYLAPFLSFPFRNYRGGNRL